MSHERLNTYDFEMYVWNPWVCKLYKVLNTDSVKEITLDVYSTGNLQLASNAMNLLHILHTASKEYDLFISYNSWKPI